MKKTRFYRIALLFLASLFILSTQTIKAQSGASAVLDSATLDAQLNYIHENTRVYNDYRAIRDDIFLKMKRNVRDTLNASRLNVEELKCLLSVRDFEIVTLETDVC